jgi:hypothetical protein
VVRDDQPDAREGQAGRCGETEGFVVPLKPGIQRSKLFSGAERFRSVFPRRIPHFAPHNNWVDPSAFSMR